MAKFRAAGVAISGGKVVYVGSDAGVDSYIGKQTQLIVWPGAWQCRASSMRTCKGWRSRHGLVRPEMQT
jgi:hypothetical protein